MIKAVVTGAGGRMGAMIVRIITETPGIEVAGAVEHPAHASLGRDAGDVAGIGPIGVDITPSLAEKLKDADVVIDFTSAKASMDNLAVARSLGKAIVIGSTGFTPEEKKVITSTTDAKVFFTPNMSLSMNVLFKLVADAARLLGDDYDIEIIEAHHRFKKDSPSGSAKGLAEAIADATGRDLATDAVYGREGMVGERTRREIGMHAVRLGDVVGDHTVIFGSLGERLEFTHRVSSRETFARGAVRAALWIPAQKPGVHDMMELLGLK